MKGHWLCQLGRPESEADRRLEPRGWAGMPSSVRRGVGFGPS